MSNRIVIVGGGPAGIEAARAAASSGSEVTLVTEGQVGGRAGWHSLLPSKVWLSAAGIAGWMSESPLAGNREIPSPAAILPHLNHIREQWNSQQTESLKSLGVTIITGVASFDAADRIVVRDNDAPPTSLPGDAVILATGSVPHFPPGLRPDGKKVIAPRFLSGLKTLPANVVVIGAGATGTEMVYLFNRLGVKVTWLVDRFGVLPSFPPDAGKLLARILVLRGVNLVRIDLADHFEYEGNEVAVVMSDGKREKAEMVFVSVGRFPDLRRLNLKSAGIDLAESYFPETDNFCRTRVRHIYAVGDAAGPPMVANRAMAMARVAGLHASGSEVAPYNPNSVVAAVYTEPQVAMVGDLGSNEDPIQTTRMPMNTILKTQLLPENEGYIEIAFNKEGIVEGGHAVGPHAGDVLAPVALAVQVKATLKDMAALYAAHPSLSELPFAAARQRGI